MGLNTPEEIDGKVADYVAGRFGSLTTDEIIEIREAGEDPFGERAAREDADARNCAAGDGAGQLPLDLQHPGGLVEDAMDWINATAVCPQPAFALAAALCLAGTIYGRRVQDESGLRTNLFLMGVGYTSCGKDHALKAVSRILDAGDATHLRLGQVTSDSAVEYALRRNPRFAMLIDEAGHFFAGVTDARAAGSPLRTLKPALLELWSSAGGRWKGKQRVPSRGTDSPPALIDDPHVCLFGMTQPQIFFDGVSKTELRDGWLARNLFFISKARPKPRFVDRAAVPARLSGEVRRLGAEPDATRTILADPEARAVFGAFNDDVYAKMLAADRTGDETNYLYGKALENARRVALTLAAGRADSGTLNFGGALPSITADDAAYGCALVRYLIEDLIRSVRETVAESQDEKAKKRILQIVAKAGRISKQNLTRKTQFIRKTFRDEYLDDLVQSGELAVEQGDERGVAYRLGAGC